MTALKQMAYLIFIAHGEEYDRRELRGPILLGRAPDCDLAIPDITLSRHHCRVEPSENGRGWQLIDLHSKNGTQFRGQNIESHVLRDGDELRIGRTRLTFKSGKFVKASGKSQSKAVIRAVDPHEALSGTVSGMVVCEPGETEKHEGMPVPQPRALDPGRYQQDDPHGALKEIAAGSPASIDARKSTPARIHRAAPVPVVTPAEQARSRPRVSFELQADHSESHGESHSEGHGEGHLSVTSSEIVSGGSVAGRSMSGRSVSGASLSRAAQRKEPAPLRPAPLLAPQQPGRRWRLIIGAAACIAVMVSVAAWAMLVHGRDQGNEVELLAPAPAAPGQADLSLSPDPVAMTASAVDRGVDPSRALPSRRLAVRAKPSIIPPPRVKIPVPPAEKLDHLTTFELIFPVENHLAQRPRPTDIAPDDLLGSPEIPSHPDPLTGH